MPATDTSDTRNSPTVLAAHSRGVTRRCTGLTDMTSMAARSSRILRAPMSAVIADPPAPAMSRAVATGAASRTMASTIAAPVVDSAPSWREKSPTCSAITAPKGMEISTDGMLVTFAMNQHWRRYSCHQERTSQVRRRPSRDTANRFPVSRTTNWTLPIIVGAQSDREDGVGVGGAVRLHASSLARHEVALDVALLQRELVHPDRTGSPAGQELADDLVVGRAHLGLGRELHEPRSEEHTSELQSLMRISYAVFCLKKKKHQQQNTRH